MRRSASEIIRNLEMRIARLERQATSNRTAAGKAQLKGVKSSTAYHEGMSMASASSAMLYMISENANNSKFYEMVVVPNGVNILHGRLGSDGKRADKTFSDQMKAEKFFQKQLKSKLGKGYVSAYSRTGLHKKQGPNYGSYPIGLTQNPGPWKNQDIAYDTAMLKDTISVISDAIASFKDDGIVDENAVAMLMSTQRSLSSNSDQLSSHAANEMRLALDRIKGTGRAGRQPAETRIRNAIKGLQKLMRKLNGAMAGGHRRMASDRTASSKIEVSINTGAPGNKVEKMTVKELLSLVKYVSQGTGRRCMVNIIPNGERSKINFICHSEGVRISDVQWSCSVDLFSFALAVEKSHPSEMDSLYMNAGIHDLEDRFEGDVDIAYAIKDYLQTSRGSFGGGLGRGWFVEVI